MRCPTTWRQCATSNASDQPAHTLTIKLLTEQHFKFLTLKGGCTGLSESIHVKTAHCWKSHVAAHFIECGEIRLYMYFRITR